MKSTVKLCAAAGLAALVGSGVGLAAASTGEPRITADTTIVGCVHLDTKAVRIVSRPRKCRDSEKVLKWNQVGPAGPQGVAGADGAPGVPGVDGRTLGYFGIQPTAPAPAALRPNTLTTILTVPDVPKGLYQGTLSTIITTDGLPRGIDVSVYCRVIDESTTRSRTANFFALPNRWATVSAELRFRVADDGTDVQIGCQGDPAVLVDTRLSFVKVVG